MIVLTTSTSSQSFNFIPRTGTQPTVMLITDEETNTTENVTISSYVVDTYFDTITATFNLKEGRYYTVRLQNFDSDEYLQTDDFSFLLTSQNDRIGIDGYDGTTEVMYVGKIFCTDQTTDYSVNSGQYQQKNSTNDFLYL
jgi:hypothetical protein